MKGEKLLKITGILMIIGGGISIILGIVALLGVGALSYVTDGAVGGMALLYAGSALILVSGAIELVAGILGVKNCKKPEKAMVCIVMGAIVAAMCIIGQILNVIGGTSVSVVSIITGLALPVLYIIGAVLNKKENI